MDETEAREGRELGRLGLLNGLVIGLALALGLWLPGIISLAGVPTTFLPLATVVIFSLLVIAICCLAGWVTGRLHRTGASLVAWLLAGIAIMLIVAFRDYQLSTVFVWLLEPTLSGEAIFPPFAGKLAGIILAGLLVLLVLITLALIQEYRLEGLLGEVKAGGGLTPSGWWRLLLPGVVVLGAGLVTGNFFGNQTTFQALQNTHRAIEVARSYEGDLFALGREEGLNYAALRGVQEQLGPDYTLFLVATDQETGQTIVTAHFASGAWINCNFVYEHLVFCGDASAPYTEGFAALITGNEPSCDDCLPQADANWIDWLGERRSRFGGDPEISFARQWGNHVRMRATAPDGDYAISCWFQGVDPVRLLSCQERES